MPDPASITLNRDGVSVTVKVGDVVPMTDSTSGTVDDLNIEDGHVRVKCSDDSWWFGKDGRFLTNMRVIPRFGIDLAALAAPGAPAVPAERVLALLHEVNEKITKFEQVAAPGEQSEAGRMSRAVVNNLRWVAAAIEALVPSKESSDG